MPNNQSYYNLINAEKELIGPAVTKTNFRSAKQHSRHSPKEKDQDSSWSLC